MKSAAKPLPHSASDPDRPQPLPVPARPLPSIFLEREAVAIMQRLVATVSGTTPLHVGGLLLGGISKGPRPSIFVSRFQSLPWDPSRGGAPFLTPVHERVLSQSFHQSSTTTGAPTIIGFWRTARLGEVAPSEQDWALLLKYFSSAQRAICLQVTPVSPTTSLAAAFFHGFEGVDRSSFVQLLLEIEGDKPARKTGGSPALRSMGESLRRWSLTLVAGGLLCLAAVMAHLGSSRGVDVTSEEQVKPPLELRAARVGNDFVILWARATPAGKPFVRGKLTITDAGARKEFLLDRLQMTGARMLYQPASSDVSFQLDAVTEDNLEVAESIRTYQAVPPLAANPATLLDSVGMKTPTAGEPSKVSVEMATIPLLREQSRARGEWDQIPAAPKQARLYQYVPPKKVAPVVQMLDLPQISDKVDLSRQPLLEIAAQQIPGAPIPPPEPQPVAPEPVAPRESPAIAEPAVVSTEASNGRMSAPIPILMPKPIYTRQVANMLNGPTEIIVHVKIDEDGHVVDATADTPASLMFSLLKQSAIAAARGWRFKPATLEGRPVLSETDLRFRFVR